MLNLSSETYKTGEQLNINNSVPHAWKDKLFYFPLYKKKISSSNRIVSLDPGIRVFLTGISDDHSIEYGVNLSDIVEYKIKHIDHIQCNSSIFPDRKKKIVDRLKNNLSNLIDDFHWKITNNIVKNYKHVLIGNMSSKSIGEGNITD